MEFYLNCWVPSLSGFYKIKELKNSQLILLSKFILNQDHEGTSKCFEYILQENLIDTTLKLTRFDKWFVLCFLRAANISPILYLQTVNAANLPCNVELALFDVLSKLSECIRIEPYHFSFSKINFELLPSSQLYTVEPVIESIVNLKFNEKTISNFDDIKDLLFSFNNLRDLIAQELIKKDNDSQHFIINSNTSLNLDSVQIRLFDNTLFFFLRSIFLPFCKELHEKHYRLMKYAKFSYEELKQLTPSEGDIFLNFYTKDEASKAQSDSVNIQ